MKLSVCKKDKATMDVTGREEYYLGIDLGGTDVKYGIVSRDNLIIVNYKEPTQTSSEGALLTQLKNICRKMMAEYHVKAVGIGIPGNVSMRTGRVDFSVNLPFNNTDVEEYLTRALDISVKIAKDANCAALYEHLAGGGKDFDNMVMITIGTGIGGGIVINGKLYISTKEDAGEIGRACGCGQEGCFEKYAAASALTQAAKDAATSAPNSILAKRISENVSAKAVFEALDEGCGIALDVYNNWIYELAIGIKSLVRIFSPDVIVMSGGVMHQAEKIIPDLMKQCGDVKIVNSKGGNAAGIIGAAMLQYRGIK